MSTTSLFVELIVIGVGAAAWVGLFAMALAGYEWIPNGGAAYALPAPVLGLLALLTLSIIYVLGILIDRLAYAVFERAADRLAHEVFPDRGDLLRARALMYTEGAGLRDLYEYSRSRLRICRGWTLNAALMAVGFVLFVWTQVPASYDRTRLSLAALAVFAALAYGANLAWRALARSEYRMLRRQFEFTVGDRDQPRPGQ